MARSRFDRLDPDKQEAILAAAAEEFAERGYEAASLNRIAERSGSSKGTLYYYFEDKADLFATVLERAFARMAEAAGGFTLGSLTPESYWESFREFTRRSLEYLRRNEWFVKLGRSFHRLRFEGGADPAAVRVLESGRRLTEAVLARGQELGVVRTDLPLRLLVELTLAVDDVADRWYLERWEELTEAEARDLMEGIMDVLRDMLDARNEGWER